jgi:hypothetical protein
VAGAMAMLYEAWYNNYCGNNHYQDGVTTNPLSSSIRALIFHTAKDLEFYGYHPGPDYYTGYGLLQIDSALDMVDKASPSNRTIIEGSVDDATTDTLIVTVPSTWPEGVPHELKATLVWDDWDGNWNQYDQNNGTTLAEKSLVNDLDLVIESPSHTLYYPFMFEVTTDGNGHEVLNGIDIDGHPSQSGTHPAAQHGVNIRDNHEQIVRVTIWRRPATGRSTSRVRTSSIQARPIRTTPINPTPIWARPIRSCAIWL